MRASPLREELREEPTMKLSDYDLLYDLPSGEYDGAGIKGIRTVTIRAGASLEVMCHPLLKQWPAGARREKKARKTKEAMEKINRRNRMLRELRLLEENFTERAFVLTYTYAYPAEDYGFMNRDDMLDYYEKNRLPEDEDAVRRDVRNFLGKVRRRMQDPKKLKWDMHIEEGVKEQPFGMPNHLHAHMVIEAEGLTQDELKALWPHGLLQCDRFDKSNDGAKRLANYFNKQKRGRRWWTHSRNLREPRVTVSDRKVSRRRAMRVASDVMQYGREIMEKLYPGYKLMELPRVRYSDYMPGAYIYCRMRRND